MAESADTRTEQCPWCGATLIGNVTRCYVCHKSLELPKSRWSRVGDTLLRTLFSKAFVVGSVALAAAGLMLLIASLAAGITWGAIIGPVMCVPLALVLCVLVLLMGGKK
jgi:hypothetical protein